MLIQYVYNDNMNMCKIQKYLCKSVIILKHAERGYNYSDEQINIIVAHYFINVFSFNFGNERNCGNIIYRIFPSRLFSNYQAVFLVRSVLPAHRSSLEPNPSVGLMAPALAICVSSEARHARQKTTPSNMSAMGTVPVCIEINELNA